MTYYEILDTDEEIKTAEHDVAGDVGEDTAIEVQTFDTGYLRIAVIHDLASGDAALIIESVEQTVEGELASEVSLLQPGSADLGEFEAQNPLCRGGHHHQESD
jgi:hypothetical protein